MINYCFLLGVSAYCYICLYLGYNPIDLFVGSIVIAIGNTIAIATVCGYSFFILPRIAVAGANAESCYWSDAILICWAMYARDVKTRWDNKGYKEIDPTYLNVPRWIIIGLFINLGEVLIFLLWTMWKYLAIGIGKTICFFGRFSWHLFRLIHSEKRVLCGIDGAFGGLISYLWFSSSAGSLPEQAIMLVLFGGLLGAVVGVADWELISKRILQLHLAASNSHS